MTSTLEAPAPIDISAPKPRQAVLTSHDRCDTKECGAQAYVSVLLESGELLFCNHHWTVKKANVEGVAVKINDESWRLTDKRLDVSA